MATAAALAEDDHAAKGVLWLAVAVAVLRHKPAGVDVREYLASIAAPPPLAPPATQWPRATLFTPPRSSQRACESQQLALAAVPASQFTQLAAAPSIEAGTAPTSTETPAVDPLPHPTQDTISTGAPMPSMLLQLHPPRTGSASLDDKATNELIYCNMLIMAARRKDVTVARCWRDFALHPSSATDRSKGRATISQLPRIAASHVLDCLTRLCSAIGLRPADGFLEAAEGVLALLGAMLREEDPHGLVGDNRQVGRDAHALAYQLAHAIAAADPPVSIDRAVSLCDKLLALPLPPLGFHLAEALTHELGVLLRTLCDSEAGLAERLARLASASLLVHLLALCCRVPADPRTPDAATQHAAKVCDAVHGALITLSLPCHPLFRSLAYAIAGLVARIRALPAEAQGHPL